MTNSRSKQAIFMNFGYINNHITLRGSLDSSEVVESEVGQPLQEDQRQHHSTPGELYRWCHTWRKSTAGDQGGISFPKPRTEAGKAGLHQERRQAASGPSLAPCQRNLGRPDKTTRTMPKKSRSARENQACRGWEGGRARFHGVQITFFTSMSENVNTPP